MAVKSYRELIAWQKAMDVVEAVYKATRQFPKEELFVLTSQMRRASISVPSNIAEGQGRNSTKEFIHHLSISYGSLTELETQILIAERLGYTATDQTATLLKQTAEVGRLLNGLTKALEARL
jgi:four helix bundle protein